MREPEEGDRLVCPKCPESVKVSLEDPDASFSDLWNHLRRAHPGHNTHTLARQVVLEDRLGNIVKES